MSQSFSMMGKILLVVLLLSECFVFSTCLLHQYHFVNQSLNWTEAQTYCRQKHTDLVTIRTSKDVDQLTSILSSAGHNSEVWIGLYSEIDWRWSDGFNGSGAEFRDWHPYMPRSSYIQNDFCVILAFRSNWWNVDCSSGYPFVCSKGTQLNSSFVFVSQTMTWSGAQKYCRENFIDLATVKNETENQMIKDLVPDGHPWIGLFRDPNLHWSDGSSFAFRNWDSDYNPFGSAKVICGVTSSQRLGKWKFLFCGTRLPFVCYDLLEPKQEQVVKLSLKMKDSVDLNDIVTKERILTKLQDILKKNGVNGVNLMWREQPDGHVFKKERERKKTEF